ncbi:MAG: LamG-like jellyroll fold domain-containing protein, partial [Oceanipulchritudo sp.]
MKNTGRLGTLAAYASMGILAYGQGLEVTRGLAVALEAKDGMVLNATSAAAAAGENVAIWSDGTAVFNLANNTNPADGPVYCDVGDASFNATLFNGKGYLEFEAPASGEHTGAGDALYSNGPILMPARTGAMPGSIFAVIAPQISIDRGDIIGTRSNDPDSGTSNGFFIEPRLVSGTTDIERFWLGNPGGAGGYEGTVTAFSGGSMANDASQAYILEWRSLSSTDADGHRAFYINGEWVGEDTESVVVPSSVAKFGIGGSPDNLNAFNGAMAAVMVFDEELNEAERNAVGVYLQNEYGISGAYAAPELPSSGSILIDFGKATLASGGGDPAWNDVVPPAEGSSITGAAMADTTFPYTLVEDLVDDSGASTGIRLVYTEWIPGPDPSQNGNGIAGMEVAGEMPDTGYPESATIDSLYVNSGAMVVLSLEGLDPKMAYDLKFFGTSSAT